jgi:hypothetical protein
MKSFSEYLIESDQKTYDFKVKVAMRVDDLHLDQIEAALKAVDLVKVGKVTNLPMQAHREFPAKGPIEVSLFDVSVRFPSTEDQIRNLITSRALIPAASVFVYTKGQFEIGDKISPESAAASKEAILTKELEVGESAQEQVGDKKVTSFMKELQTRKYELEGEKTAKAKTTNDLPQGNDSPLSKVKRK